MTRRIKDVGQHSIVVTGAIPYGDQKGWAGDRKGCGRQS